ncbi:helix-turn-helix transcriptional regulator [Sphingobium sp. HBC34]|uniref:Helix-turn-helix transcriptional regulator n=1 Tax=Sphingobium cyanobacteriorum TaxID=3063954 RepID=A0ABT8ZRV6_9SPHN|nr:helix-turn-helix transcriptional regulator [Sphingobium sp. HBC34]MDO7836932.1 helix-turn-helix transcriptional regulator [Sphingobium sp. HBC34]
MAETLPVLSEGEKQCLRLVAQGFNSKEIARQLHVSEHTVDQRVRTSLRKFGVANRKEAARLFISVEQRPPQSDTYQPLIYQSEPLASDPDPASSPDQPDRPDGQGEHRTLLHRILAFGPPLGGSTNELSIDGRILAMIRAAVLTGVGVVALLLLIRGAFTVLG